MNEDKTPETLDVEFRELEAAVLGQTLPASLRHDIMTLVPEFPQETAVATMSDNANLPGQPVEAPPMVQFESLAAPQKPVNGAGPGFWGVTAALGWVGTAMGAPLAYIGLDALPYQHPALLVGIAATAVLPGALILFSASAAREARRARTEAAHLSKVASEVLVPTAAVEERTRALGRTVRDEIGALTTVVNSALDRFAELEAAAQRNTTVFDMVVSSARESASTLAVALQSERNAFEDLTTELRTQSDSLGENVGRQIRLMREASRMVRQEYVAADETFQAHLSSFAASAAAMAERTDQLDKAATNTTMATQRLDTTIVSALESLTHATSLTDTARQSAENATQAAAATATAVRETTQRAVADARRVAQMIRNETQAMEDSANSTLSKLKDAAEEARRASEEAQAAADRHAASIQRRLSAMAGTAQVAQKVVAEPAPHAQIEAVEKVFASAGGRSARVAHVRTETVETATGFAPSAPANENGAGHYAPAQPSLADQALAMLGHVGVRPLEVFTSTDLDFIAARARQGASARRQAVQAAAPDVVQRLAGLFQNSPQAQAEAQAFRGKPDLGAHPGGKSVLVAYLLVDAALD